MPENSEPKGIYLNAAVKPLEERPVPSHVVRMAEQTGVELVGYRDALNIYAQCKAEGGPQAQPPTIEGFVVRPCSKKADK